jgi:CBS domain-containing protein
MPQLVQDVMTTELVTLPPTGTVAEAARLMLENDVGDVLVVDGDQLIGLVTDRDIVVRSVALDLDPDETTVGSICSAIVTAVRPGTSVADSLALMRGHAIRRLPVTTEGRPVGVLTIGDLALESDPDSVLADISAAEPNR